MLNSVDVKIIGVKSYMATVAKALGQFGAKEGECVVRWTAKPNTTRRLYNPAGQEMIGAVVLALRGEARTYGMNTLEQELQISWPVLETRLEMRIDFRKETAQVISRFFTSSAATDYKTFVGMLKYADLMLRRGCISNDQLVKQVIIRSTVEMKSVLIKLAYGNGV